jgi:hypothetical protein
MRHDLLNVALGLGLALGVAAGCDKPKKHDDDAADGPAADGGQDAGAADAGADEGPSADGTKHEGPDVDDDEGGGEAQGGYAPTGGDKTELAAHSKQWSSDASEPADWSATTVTDNEVVGLYAAGLSCGYRVASTTEGQPAFAYDIGCDTALSCQATQCEEKAIDAIDVGDFKQAAGKETKCSQVTENALGKSLVTTVTKTWSHPDALREEQIVKSDALSCTLPLDASEDGAGLDACAPPAGRVATISRNEQTLTAQTHGDGKPELTVEPSAAFKVEGDFTQPSDAKTQYVMCSQFGAALNVAIGRAYCDAETHKPVSYALNFASLPVPSADSHQTGAYSASLAVGSQSFIGMQAGACTISYSGDADKGTLSGQATCEPSALSVMDGSKSVTVKDLTFSCWAPTGFFE